MENIRVGQVVKLRNRLWRVDDFNEHEIVASPIDSEAQQKSSFLIDLEDIQPAQMDRISNELIGSFAYQQLLLRAYRFELLHGSAPFLSLQRSAVIPYNYQLVPLVQALERPKTRLLIADDVGLGKTIEAGLIISELKQRGRIKRILILTPAHLKDQWKESMDYFFHIDSQIISSFTRREFEKDLPSGTGPWQYFSVCIASFDYAKSPEIKYHITDNKWDLLLVDEVHLCARPHANQHATKQMKRYELIQELSKKIPNSVFLTATPHNGYSDSFASILEMLNPEIVSYHNGMVALHKSKAKYNVCQRNRKKLDEWFVNYNLKSPFPERKSEEVRIKLNTSYSDLMEEVAIFGDIIIRDNVSDRRKKNVSNWVALHFQKRAISSPYAILRSLENRLNNRDGFEKNEKIDEDLFSFVHDSDSEDERLSEELVNHQLDNDAQINQEEEILKKLIAEAKKIKPNQDDKLTKLKSEVIPELFQYDNKIIVFTKYKDTLDYLYTNLNSTDYKTFVLHGDYSLKKRQEILLEFEYSEKAILIATDVISEGINLQRMCSTMVHYELPWNPNRIEQRTGRIDRIGQLKSDVHVRTLIVLDSMDMDILDLLIKKAERIRDDRGYSGAYFGDENSLVGLIEQARYRDRKRRKTKQPDKYQLSLFDDKETKYLDAAFESKFSDPFRDEIIQKIKEESFYDNIDISLPDIEKRLEETHKIIGSPDEIKSFVISAINYFNGSCVLQRNGFYKIRIPDNIKIPKYNSELTKVSFNPEDGISYPDVVVLDLGNPLIRKLIEKVKAEFFNNPSVYGRTSYRFSDKAESVIYEYNFLVRFTAGRIQKRVIEELITFGIDSFSKKTIPYESLKEFTPTDSIEEVNNQQITEYLSLALDEKYYEKSFNSLLQQRKDDLINERMELARKIFKETDTSEDAEWVKEIMFIEEASIDLLTINIILPSNL